MRTIEYARRFKRDYRRLRMGAPGDRIRQELEAVLDLLAHDRELPRRYADHRLSGDWQDHRDCHVRPDLTLI